jgi:hypothetical protein
MPSVVGHSAVPVRDPSKRINEWTSLIIAGLPDDCGRVQARLLSDVAVIRSRSDQSAAVLAGHARNPSRQEPVADENEVVDESRTPHVTGRKHKGADNRITAVRGLVDRVGARVEQWRVHLMVVKNPLDLLTAIIGP